MLVVIIQQNGALPLQSHFLENINLIFLSPPILSDHSRAHILLLQLIFFFFFFLEQLRFLLGKRNLLLLFLIPIRQWYKQPFSHDWFPVSLIFLNYAILVQNDEILGPACADTFVGGMSLYFDLFLEFGVQGGGFAGTRGGFEGMAATATTATHFAFGNLMDV